MLFNSFLPNAPFFYFLKTSEYCKVFLCFHGVEKGCIGNKWVNKENNTVSSFKTPQRFSLNWYAEPELKEGPFVESDPRLLCQDFLFIFCISMILLILVIRNVSCTIYDKEPVLD